MKKEVCNRDCFNCIYKDCIVDGVLPGESKEIRLRDEKFTGHQYIPMAVHERRRIKAKDYRHAGL